jgi:hypothetical protein
MLTLLESDDGARRRLTAPCAPAQGPATVCTSVWTLPATAAAEPRSEAPCRSPACPPAAMAPCEWLPCAPAVPVGAGSAAAGALQAYNLRTKLRRAGAFPALSALASAPFQCISVNAASPAAAGSSADAAERGLAWPIGAAARAASQSELWVPPRKLFHPPPPRAAPPAPGVPRFSRPPLLTPHPGSLAQGPPEWEAISWARCSRRPHGRQLAQMLSGGLPARHIWPAPGRPRRQSLLWCIVAAPGQTSAVV